MTCKIFIPAEQKYESLAMEWKYDVSTFTLSEARKHKDELLHIGHSNVMIEDMLTGKIHHYDWEHPQ